MADPEEMLTVAQAAARCGVSVHTLRYYERAGLLTDVPRTVSGRRRYGRRELGAVEFVTRLRATGMPIATILAYADLVRAGEGNEQERLAILLGHSEAVRRSLDEQSRHLDAIHRKIDLYQEHLASGTAAGPSDAPDRTLA